jgi:O-antigen/teichoic acid export membrane protein
LDLANLGNYKTFFSVLNILAIFSIVGLNNSISKAVAKRYKVFFIKATNLSIIFSTIISFILVVLSFTYYKDSTIKYTLIYSSLIIPFYFGLNTWESFFLGQRNFKRIFINYCFIIVTRLAFLFVILFYTGNYLYAIIAYLFVDTVYSLTFHFLIRRKTDWEKVDLKLEKEYINHGFRLTGASAVSAVANNIERVILYAASSASLVGVYSIIDIVPTMAKNFIKTIISIPTMELTRLPEKDNRRIIRKYLYLIFIVSALIVLVLWFVGPPLLKFFFNVTDESTLKYSRFILLYLLFVPFNLTIKYMCVYQGSGTSYFKLNTTIDSIKLIFLAVFIPFLKIYGVIIALVLNEFVSTVILLVWFIKSGKKFKSDG